MRTLIEFFAIQVFVLVFTYLHIGHVSAGHVLGSVLGGLCSRCAGTTGIPEIDDAAAARLAAHQLTFAF